MVMTTSTAGLRYLGTLSTGMPRPLSVTVTELSGVDDDVDLRAVAGERLVDRVVDHLVDEVVEPLGAGGSDVHARAFADRLKTFEYLDVLAGIGTRAGCHTFSPIRAWETQAPSAIP